MTSLICGTYETSNSDTEVGGGADEKGEGRGEKNTQLLDITVRT